MDTDAPAETPYIPLRHSRWPSQRAPRWLILAGVVLLAGAVLVGWAHHPTRGQRATDMNGFLTDMKTDIESCAGGVRESLYVLRQIGSGAQKDVATAINVATTGAANCGPANNTQIDDLAQYQVHESLAAFHLSSAVDGLVTWAFPDAENVMTDVATILSSHGSAQVAARAKLKKDLVVLDAQRAKVDAIMQRARTATGATAKLPVLPG